MSDKGTVAERPDKRILHCLFRVLVVTENSQGDAKDAALVPADEGFEGSPVSAQYTVEQDQIVLARRTFVLSFGFLHRHNM